MKAIQAHRIQASGNRAQVIVLIGEGAVRKSVTRHAVREKGLWVGQNPDEAVRELHANGNRVLIDAEDDVAKAKKELAAAEKIENPEKKDRNMKWAKVLLRQAELRLSSAENNMKTIEKDFPLKVHFVQ